MRFWAITDKAENIALVAEIKKYPCIYNNKISDYDRRDIVDAAWKTIAATTGGTVSICKQKWRYLRAVFVKRRRVRRKFGSEPSKLNYLNNIMQFIVPFIRKRKPARNKRRTVSSGSSSGDDYEECDAKEDVSHSVAKQPPTRSKNGLSNTANAERAPQPRNEARKPNQDFRSECIERKVSKSSIQEEHRNARKLFLLSVLPDVENFTGQQYSIFRRKLLDGIDYAGSYQDYSICDSILSPASSSLTQQSTAASSKFVYACDDDAS